MLNITNHQESQDTNHTEIPLHTYQNDYIIKKTITIVDENLEKGEALCTAGRNVNWCNHYGKYFGHLMQRADSLEKTLMLGNIEGRRRRGQERTRWLDGIMGSMDMSLSKL